MVRKNSTKMQYLINPPELELQEQKQIRYKLTFHNQLTKPGGWSYKRKLELALGL